MELRQVKGNTWILDSWELIPLYKLDAHRCVLLDTGTWDQRDELEAALDAAGRSLKFCPRRGTPSTTSACGPRTTCCIWPTP